MTTVRDKMTSDLCVLDATNTLTDAARAMRDRDIGDVLVRVGGGLGIVTDRDIVVRAVAENRSMDDTKLDEIATTEVQSVAPGDDLDDVVSTMRQHDIRRVPVCEGDEPVGILSMGDLAVMRDEDSALADISAAAPNN